MITRLIRLVMAAVSIATALGMDPLGHVPGEDAHLALILRPHLLDCRVGDDPAPATLAVGGTMTR